MPRKPPDAPKPPARSLAAHVARAVQAKPVSTPPSGRQLAPHVAKAIQAKPASPPQSGRPMAPHVSQAIQADTAPRVMQPASRRKKTKKEPTKKELKKLRRMRERIQELEEHLEAPTAREPGMPPSQFPKLQEGRYPSHGQYVERRRKKQTEDRRVEIEDWDLWSLLAEVQDRGAKYMASRALINGASAYFGPTDTWSDALATPFEHDHEDEYEVSSSDVEVRFLSGALDVFIEDMEENGDGDVPRRHELVLADNFGACDGCKDRIKRFKQLWVQRATESGYTARAQLKVTYVYHQTAKEYTRKSKTTDEKIKSLYGWSEATPMTLWTGKRKLSYWSWSAKPKSYEPPNL